MRFLFIKNKNDMFHQSLFSRLILQCKPIIAIIMPLFMYHRNRSTPDPPTQARLIVSLRRAAPRRAGSAITCKRKSLRIAHIASTNKTMHSKANNDMALDRSWSDAVCASFSLSMDCSYSFYWVARFFSCIQILFTVSILLSDIYMSKPSKQTKY